MKLISFVLMSVLFSPAKICVTTELEPRETQKPGQIETTYDDKQDRTIGTTNTSADLRRERAVPQCLHCTLV